MTTPFHNLAARWWQLLFCLLGLLIASPSHATTTLKITQVSSHTEASIRDEHVVTFRLSYAVTSTSEDARKATIWFNLDRNFELVSMQRSSKVVSTDFDDASRRGSFNFGVKLDAGETGELAVQVRFARATPENTIANFQPTFSADNASSATTPAVSVKAIKPPGSGGSGPTFIKGIILEKDGPDQIQTNSPFWEYSIRHGNTGSSADPVPSYVIEDLLPAGTQLLVFGQDRFWNTSNPVTVTFRTNNNSSWRTWGSSPLYLTGGEPDGLAVDGRHRQRQR